MKEQTLAKEYIEELTALFDQQLDKSKEIVRTFINNIFGAGKGNEYTDRKIYDYFYSFNFDWLNYDCNLFSESTKKEIPNWCYASIRILLEEIQKAFTQLTNILDDKKLETISKLKNKDFRGTADPDSMRIVCHILFIIYADIIKCTLNNLTLDQAEHIIKNKDFTYLFKGDTMHSFHTSFGHAEYSGHKVINTINEYIFMYPYISGFSKVQSADVETMQKMKGFFNQYHTLGNIVLSPAIKVGSKSINVDRFRFDYDNYYAYLDQLFGDHDDSLGKLIQENSGFFSIFDRDREKYCDMLDILDSEGPAYTRTKEAVCATHNSDDIQKNIDVTQSIIKARCDRIISKLYDALQG